jgi:hypothetical protein
MCDVVRALHPQVFSHCINMHRQAMRDASLFSGMLLALMASRSYNSTRAQQYLSEFMIGLASRYAPVQGQRQVLP